MNTHNICDEKDTFEEMKRMSALNYYNALSWVFIMQGHCNNSLRVDMSLHSPLGHIILIPSQPAFARSPYCRVLSGEATNTNFIVFGLTRPGLEPTIYRTRGEHANH